jgi:hypothetical protein
MSTFYLGSTPQDALAGLVKRYFYGLRRNDDGELFLIRIDQLQGGDQQVATINEVGTADGNFPDFEEGINFLDGIDQDHEIIYENLRYQQLRWDGRSLTYFVDPEDGSFNVRISEDYVYPDGISGPGF